MSRVPFDPATDYYKLLGVGADASAEEIQAAYRRLAKAYHPDLNAGSAVAAARMARVNLAKTVLLDRETRAHYDLIRATRRQYKRVRVPPAPPPPPPPAGGVTVRYAPHQVDWRPRHRVVSSRIKERAVRGRFDKQSALLLLVAIPLVAAVAMYVFQAIQLSIQPLRTAPSDLSLSVGPNRPTQRGSCGCGRGREASWPGTPSMGSSPHRARRTTAPPSGALAAPRRHR